MALWAQTWLCIPMCVDTAQQLRALTDSSFCFLLQFSNAEKRGYCSEFNVGTGEGGSHHQHPLCEEHVCCSHVLATGCPSLTT